MLRRLDSITNFIICGWRNCYQHNNRDPIWKTVGAFFGLDGFVGAIGIMQASIQRQSSDRYRKICSDFYLRLSEPNFRVFYHILTSPIFLAHTYATLFYASYTLSTAMTKNRSNHRLYLCSAQSQKHELSHKLDRSAETCLMLYPVTNFEHIPIVFQISATFTSTPIKSLFIHSACLLPWACYSFPFDFALAENY